MKDKPLTDNAYFLKKHYGENGAGFYFNDRKISIWYNEDGIRIAYGSSAVKRVAYYLGTSGKANPGITGHGTVYAAERTGAG